MWPDGRSRPILAASGGGEMWQRTRLAARARPEGVRVQLATEARPTVGRIRPMVGSCTEGGRIQLAGFFDSVRCLRDMRGGVASALSTLSALRCGVCEGAESVCEEVECTGVECTGAQAASDCGGRRRGAESVCQRVRKACARGCGRREDYGGRRSTGSWEAVGARPATRAVGATEGVFCAKRGTSRSFLFHLAQEGTIRPGEMVRIFRLERLEGVLGLREVPRFAHFAFVSAQRMREGFQFAGSPDASAGMSGAPTCRCHAGCRRRAGCCRYAADVLAAAGASPICCRRDDCCRPTRFRSRGCAIRILW